MSAVIFNLASPGTIGGTTPGAATFTTLAFTTASGGDITLGTDKKISGTNSTTVQVDANFQMRLRDGGTNINNFYSYGNYAFHAGGAFADQVVALVFDQTSAVFSGTLTTSGAINNVTITAPATSATLTLATGSTLATVGAFSTTFTATATTALTLPTTGTLATLAGTEALTGKTINGLSVTTSTGTLTVQNGVTLNSGAASGTVLISGGALGTPSSGTLTNCTIPASGISAGILTATTGGTTEHTITSSPDGSAVAKTNVVAVKATTAAGFSAIRFLDNSGNERAAIGQANSATPGYWLNTVFFEASHIEDQTTAPPEIGLAQTGLIGSYATYRRLYFGTDGAFHIPALTANTLHPLDWMSLDATAGTINTKLVAVATSAMHRVQTNYANNNTVEIQNTNTQGYSASRVLDSSGGERLVFGYANASASAYAGLAYLIGSSSTPLVFGQGASEQMRLSVAGGLSIGSTTDPGAGNVKVNGTITIGAGGAITSSGQGGALGSGAFVAKPAIFDSFASVSSTHTDGTEDDLFSYTTAASQLANNGEAIEEVEHVSFVSSATAARRLKKYFGGTLIFDSGAITLTLGGEFTLFTTVVRESSSIVRVDVSVTSTSASTIPYSTYTRITGLTLSSTNVLKTTGIASGTGAASADIANNMSKVTWLSAA